MFDPLSPSNSGFASYDAQTPPWPTTPHAANSVIPNLRRGSSHNHPNTANRIDPSEGIYGKEPQIYGQPESGLVSPRETIGSNGTSFEKSEPYLRVRITGLDRNRRDILVKLDAQTNLSNFTGTTYRNISRSYLELQQFYDSLIQNNPQTIIPALPLAQTSAPTDEEDDRLVKIMLQRWMSRVCDDPILLGDEDLRSFIESDFGYQPMPRLRKKTTSGFALMRRGVPDEDEELQKARFELTKLETQFFDTAKAVDKLSLVRKSLATAQAEMGNKLINVATTEAHPPLGNALRKIGRTWHSVADLDLAQAISECVIIGDSFGYQGMNARSAKETLQMRTGVLEEYQSAVKTTIAKRRHIERLKASSNIRSEKVDEALEDLEEADKYEQVLSKRAEGISYNLHQALRTHNQNATDDISAALIEHARSSIMYERQLLRELESLRVDVANAAKMVPASAITSKPSIIPPLEDRAKFGTPTSALAFSGISRTPFSPDAPPISADSVDPFSRNFAPPSPFARVSYSHAPATNISRTQSPNQQSSSTTARQPFVPQEAVGHTSFPPSSPGAGPSLFTASTSGHLIIEPLLGGQINDGVKSMHAKSPRFSPLVSPPPSQIPDPSSPAIDPLRNDNNVPEGPSPLQEQSLRSANSQGSSMDTPGWINSQQMAASLRVQPTRPRLDPREAASKLANMF